PDIIKLVSLAVTVAVFLATCVVAFGWFGAEQVQFQKGVAEMQDAFSLPWIPSFNIYYLMGMDGISFTLVMLTAFVTMLSMGASWNIEKHVKAYCILFLLLETGMLGVFLALDFFLFYVFWEVMLLPMYFLIGVWGGPRRDYAAIKFFLYTLLGSVFMLIAILMLYFNSDLRQLGDDQLLAAHVVQPVGADYNAADQAAAIRNIRRQPTEQHTFNILALAQMGQHTSLFDDELLWGKSLQWWAFLLLLVGFIIKVPAVPVHTWLPDAHVEAPTPISMILAGILLKMGGYGIIRICYPICPDAAYDLAWLVVSIGVLSMVYGAFAALAQKDFKRLVAYSSVSHMGYVMVGIGVWSAWSGTNYNPEYWQMGMNGAMFQMIAHGISSPGMFFMVGVIYDRVHHRNLDEFGGLFARAPVYSGIAFGIFFAGLGLPGLCGFIGEVFVTLSVWNYSHALAVISAATVILTAGYILWTLQRVYLGAEYKGPHGDHITPITGR
ncbi:MAG: complex I subunit 4 family protein, partial [Pirellulales bacterium]